MAILTQSAVVGYWWKTVHWELVNHLVDLSLPEEAWLG